MGISEDLKKISKLDDDVYDDVLAIFSSLELNSLERQLALQNRVELDSDSNVKAFLNFLEFVSEVTTDARDLVDDVDELEEWITKLVAGDDDAQSGWERIQKSIPSLSNYLVYKKTEKIKDRFSKVSSFQITSDIRPIFNMERTQIENEIFPHILKIETSDDKAFICEFYDDQLENLASEIALAKKKMELIRVKYGRSDS